MKPALLLCLLLTGCASPSLLLTNNTGCDLTITAQDGVIMKNVHPGQTVNVPPASYCNRTAVAVTGWKNGQYVGADSWTYYNGQPQVWEVDRLNPPQKP